MKLIRDSLYGIKKDLDEIKSLDLDDVKFNFVMSKNFKLFTNECIEMDEQIKPSEKYIEYDKKRIGLLKDKYGEKDDKGQLVIYGDPTRPQIKINQSLAKEFTKEIEKLREEYKEEIDKRDKIVADFNKMLMEEVPEQFINQIHKFYIVINEDGEPINLPNGLKQKYIDDLTDIILFEKK